MTNRYTNIILLYTKVSPLIDRCIDGLFYRVLPYNYVMSIHLRVAVTPYHSIISHTGDVDYSDTPVGTLDC